MTTESPPPTPMPVDLGRIAQDLQIRRVQVESVVQLLDEGNTVPFITRYRKERTGGLHEGVIREIEGRVRRLRELAERKETILKSIEAQGKLTEELAAAIRTADTPKRLDDLYLPYKPKRKTKASEAREKGLEPLAEAIWTGDDAAADLQEAGAAFINPEKGLETAEQALEGAGHILAELIHETAAVRAEVRRVVWRLGKIATSKSDSLAEGQGLEYRDYFNYSEPVAQVPPHRVLAINRGDKEGPLKIRLEVPREEVVAATRSQLPQLEGHRHADYLSRVLDDALDRLLLPSLEREVRRDMTDMAERHAVDVFARNLRSLLLQPPVVPQVVLALDPGFKTGCKVAVLDPQGHLLEHGVIYPHPPQNRRSESKQFLKDLVHKHNVQAVAIGNGTACRETEELVAEMIAEGTHFFQNPETPFPGTEFPAPAAAEAEAAAGGEHAAEEAPAGEPAAEMPEINLTPPSENGSSVHHEAEPTVVAQADPAPEGEAGEPEPPPVAGGAPDEGEEGTASAEAVAEPAPAAPVIEAEAQGEGGEVSLPSPVTEAPKDDSLLPSAESEALHAPAPEAASGEVAESQGGVEGAAGEAAPGGESESAAAESTEAAPAQGGEAGAGSRGPRREKGKGQGQGGRRGGDRPAPRPRPVVNVPPTPHAADELLSRLAYVIVNEAGASQYSTSNVGREEFADLDATVRGTISIGRRLQDPLSELVKIEPQHIGVGLYQHDINPKQLKESLESVIEGCVNFVGVDLNTASVPLLRHVSGLNQAIAQRLVDFRKEHGPFQGREQLAEIEGIGPVRFTQAAGFLKIRNGNNPLDRTWVHPESYEAARGLLAKLEFTPEDLLDAERTETLRGKLNELDLKEAAQELKAGEPTLDDICASLARPDRDPREDLPKPVFKRGVLKLEDLSAGMELKGTVLNVVDFGAFVDIGLKDSGLVHISQLANRFIKSPHDVVSVGDVVSVWVMSIDQERKRVSLTMVQPGTERQRPQQGGGGQRRGGGRPGGAEGQMAGGEGGEARPPRGPRRADPRGGQRPPRREGGPSDQGGGPRPEGGDRRSAPGGTPAAPAAGSRIPGPPQRMLSGRGGPGGGRPGGGGYRPRSDQRSASPTSKVPLPKPPSKPPKPMGGAGGSGGGALRGFDQLKELWSSREQKGEESQQEAPNLPTAPEPEDQAKPEPEAGQGDS